MKWITFHIVNRAGKQWTYSIPQDKVAGISLTPENEISIVTVADITYETDPYDSWQKASNMFSKLKTHWGEDIYLEHNEELE